MKTFKLIFILTLLIISISILITSIFLMTFQIINSNWQDFFISEIASKKNNSTFIDNNLYENKIINPPISIFFIFINFFITAVFLKFFQIKK